VDGIKELYDGYFFLCHICILLNEVKSVMNIVVLHFYIDNAGSSSSKS